MPFNAGGDSPYRVMVREVTRRLRDEPRVTKSVVDRWCADFRTLFQERYDEAMCDSVWDIVRAVDCAHQRAHEVFRELGGEGHRLDGKEVKRLCDLMANHFSCGELRMLLRIHFDLHDGEIEDGGLSIFVFNIVEWCEKRDVVYRLVEAIAKERPELKDRLNGLVRTPASEDVA